MNTRLYVGNLSYDTTADDLQNTFGAHGAVSDVDIVMDRTTGRPRGFAFVGMESHEGAQAAIAALDGATIDGRNLTVNEARPRESRSGSSADRGTPRREFSRS